MLKVHTDSDLRSVFKGYQGRNPREARIIFLGLDANFSPCVMKDPNSKSLITEYFKTNQGFYKDHGVHHPFLHADFPRTLALQGIKYHESFRDLGLYGYIEDISFLELLGVPTCDVGEKEPPKERDNKRRQLLSEHLDHAEFVEYLITNQEKLVFVNDGVIREMYELKKRGLFSWVPNPISVGSLEANSYVPVPIFVGQPRKTHTNLYKIIHLSALWSVKKRDRCTIYKEIRGKVIDFLNSK